MASPTPPPPSEPASPPSASNSDNAATADRNPPVSAKVEDATENGVSDVVAEEKRPDLSHFQILDSVEYLDKCKRHEADYTQRLMAKYFSKKNLYGGNVFEETMTINGETIMSSRWNCTQSFADPVKGFEEQGSTGQRMNSTSTSEE